MHRVVVTGMGCISPFGVGVDALFKGLSAAACSLAFDSELGFVVGRVPRSGSREMSGASRLALAAAHEAMSEWKSVPPSDHRSSLVCVGTGFADLEAVGDTALLIREGKIRRVSPFFVPRILNNMPAGYIAIKYGLMGGADGSSTACATGLHCIGRTKRAIAGATESCVNAIALHGFDRMRAIARGEHAASMPFDRKRAGFVLSEGAAVLLLETEKDAKMRGMSSDCHHITSPDPSGIGAFLSMQRALEDAHLEPSEVGYVNAHATSTPVGDAVEASAIAHLLPHRPPTSSYKGHFGHCLGAAGAVEMVGSVLSVEKALLFRNVGLEESDCADGVNLLTRDQAWTTERRVALVNSFGFGGTNASLVIANYQPSS